MYNNYARQRERESGIRRRWWWRKETQWHGRDQRVIKGSPGVEREIQRDERERERVKETLRKSGGREKK